MSIIDKIINGSAHAPRINPDRVERVTLALRLFMVNRPDCASVESVLSLAALIGNLSPVERAAVLSRYSADQAAMPGGAR